MQGCKFKVTISWVTDLKYSQIIQGLHINLVDLVDARNDPTKKIEHFATEFELSKYTLSTKKIFPRNHVDAGSLLEYLLRHIFNPGSVRRRRDEFDANEGRRKRRRIT